MPLNKHGLCTFIGTLSAAKIFYKKVKSNLCICSGALWLVANAFFVRSVEDGLEPSQTYDEVNKLLLLNYYSFIFKSRSKLKVEYFKANGMFFLQGKHK